MIFRSFAVMFLILLSSCHIALADGQQDAKPTGGPFPDAVERAMMIDALQQGKLFEPSEHSTITKSAKWREGELSPLSTQPQQEMNGPGWPFRTNGEIFSLPCFDERYLYFGASDGIFYCVDKKSGTVHWRKEGLKRVDSKPALHDGMVFFAAVGDLLYALKSKSGEVAWTATFPDVGYQSPKLIDDVVYITGEGQLLGVDSRNGKVLRRCAFSGNGRDFSWNSKSIAVAVSRDLDFNHDKGKGSVACFARDTAAPRWTTDLSGACLGTLVCDEDHCYLGDRGGFFYALRMADGKIAWRIDCRTLLSDQGSHNNPNSENETWPIWADGHVIDAGTHVAFSAGHQLFNASSVLASADKKTGKLGWVVPHSTHISGHFLAADGILVAMAEDRQVLLVNIADGKSVSVSPLPAVTGTGFLSDQPRGEFAGVSLDQGELFVAGADARMWRLPFDSVKGTLNWPIALSPSRSPTIRAGTWSVIGTVDGMDRITQAHIGGLLKSHGIDSAIEGSRVYGVSVPAEHAGEAIEVLKNDLKLHLFDITIYENDRPKQYRLPEKAWTTVAPKKKCDSVLRLPEFVPNADIGVLLRSREVQNEIATFPYVATLKTVRREYVAPTGDIKTGHAVQLELAVSLDEEIGGERLYFQVWDGGKQLQQTGSNEWWHGAPDTVVRNKQRYDKRRTEAPTNSNESIH